MLHNEATNNRGVITVYCISIYKAKTLLEGTFEKGENIPKEIAKDIFKLLEFKMKKFYRSDGGLNLLSNHAPLYSTYEAVKASVKGNRHLIIELELPEDSVKINDNNTCTVVSDFPLKLVNLSKLYFHCTMWSESTRNMPKMDGYVWLTNPTLLRQAGDNIFGFSEVYAQSKHSSSGTLNLLPAELQEYISLFIGAKLDPMHVNKIMNKAFNAVAAAYQSKEKLELIKAIIESNYFSDLNNAEEACIHDIKQILEDESTRKLGRIHDVVKNATEEDSKKSSSTSGITSYIPTWKKPIVLNQKVKNFLVAISDNNVGYLTSKVEAIKISNSL